MERNDQGWTSLIIKWAQKGLQEFNYGLHRLLLTFYGTVGEVFKKSIVLSIYIIRWLFTQYADKMKNNDKK